MLFANAQLHWLPCQRMSGSKVHSCMRIVVLLSACRRNLPPVLQKWRSVGLYIVVVDCCGCSGRFPFDSPVPGRHI